jgi:putative peptide zinc metalloprotease protein
MNLSEALDAALPEMPKAHLGRSRPPRLDPDLIIRHDVMDGAPVVGVLQRDKGSFFRLTPSQWQLALLFDGVRSYEEIAALYDEQTGAQLTAADVRFFAEGIEESDFWHKTQQEKNLAMHERLMAQRGRRAQRTSKFNLAHISFSAWDPDSYFNWLDKSAGRFIYSRWCLFAVILLFAFELFVFVARWSVIGPDIPTYFTFTNKTFNDIVEFWVLLLVLGFIHETAHGLTCKHYGGQVHSMGLMFLYLTPAFFVDVTESWISASRVQRLATIIAGIWIEMVVCGLAMLVWTNTAPGLWLHDLAYKVILITGVAVIVMNLNPLLKLDGYYFLTEAIGIPDLKERSTAFVSGWFQRRILRLPVEVPAIPRRRAPLFIVYALVSGAYSYLLLYTVIRFSYNVTSKWIAEFALIPAAILAFVMFRSRLRSLRSLAQQVWARNFGDRLRLRPLPAVIVALLLLLSFVPFWRDRENAYFVVEPVQPATLHAAVTGRVDAVLVKEGQPIHAGQTLIQMTSVNASAMRSGAEAIAGHARFQAFEAELHGQSIGSAAADQQAASRSRSLAREAQSSLLVRAPADGIVLTPDPAALLHQVVASGQPLLTLAGDGPRGDGSRIVRVFIPVSALDRIPAGATVALAPPGQLSIVRMPLAPIDGVAVTLPAGIVAHQNYKGVELPTFYSARMTLPAGFDRLPLGASGQAKVFGARRSLFDRFLTVLLNLFHAHVW